MTKKKIISVEIPSIFIDFSSNIFCFIKKMRIFAGEYNLRHKKQTSFAIGKMQQLAQTVYQQLAPRRHTI
jgi:hypothetical protein